MVVVPLPQAMRSHLEPLVRHRSFRQNFEVNWPPAPRRGQFYVGSPASKTGKFSYVKLKISRNFTEKRLSGHTTVEDESDGRKGILFPAVRRDCSFDFCSLLQRSW